MKIDIKHTAKLSRLSLDDNDIARFEKDMENIVQMVEKLPQISSDGALIDPSNPMTLRDDVVKTNFKREDLLKNAPQTKAGCIAVPKIVE